MLGNAVSTHHAMVLNGKQGDQLVDGEKLLAEQGTGQAWWGLC
jgi:hypothetical protein